MTAPFTREQWLAWRREGIGGSDAAALFGVDPYKSAADVYADKLGLREPQPENLVQRLGHELEPLVAAEWARVRGYRAEPPPAPIVRHAEYPELLGSLDRVFRDETGAQCVLELKTTRTPRLDAARQRGYACVPSHWVQVQHYLAVTGWSRGEIAYLLVDSAELEVVPVARDDALIEALIGVERRFWHEHVVTRIPPPPTTPRDPATLWPAATRGKTTTATPAIVAIVEELHRLRATRDELSARLEELQAAVQAHMADAEELRGPDGTLLATWRGVRGAARLDITALRRDHPDLAARYTVSAPPTRRFVLSRTPTEETAA